MSTMLPQPPVSAIKLTTSPAYLGTSFNWMLFSIMYTQALTYYRNYKRDSLKVRLLTMTLLLVDTAYTGIATFSGWDILVEHWGDISVVVAPVFTYGLEPIMSGIIASLVQHFFVWRIWTLDKTTLIRGICVIISLVSLLQLGGAIAVAKVFYNITLQSQVFVLTKAIEIWLIAGMVCDVLIAGTMTYVLQLAKARAQFRQTRDLLDRLTRQTVTTGVATAVLALIIFLVFKLIKEGTLHTGFAYCLGKFYIISFLSNLNARRRTVVVGDSTTGSGGTQNALSFRLRTRHAHAPNTGVHIDTHQEMIADDYSTIAVYSTDQKANTSSKALTTESLNEYQNKPNEP